MGIRRLDQLVQRYGTVTLRNHIDRLIVYTEERLLAELGKLPRGEFKAEGWLDDDGITQQPIHLKARVQLDGQRALFDFTGTDPQRAAPMNCNLTMTLTACVYVMKCLVSSDIPLNEGFYHPIQVIAPEGSAVNATSPVSIVGGWEVAMRLCEVLFQAFSQALPGGVPAESKGMVCQVGFGSEDPRNGGYYCFYETLAGGYGARFHSDGPDAVQTHFQNTQNASIEETELSYPVRITRYSLVPDSEGPGRTRGGLGLCREYTFVHHEPVFTILADRARFAPRGLFGGGDGQLSRYRLLREGKETGLPSKGSLLVRQGDVIRVETCGGGGYGPAWERDPELTLQDVREGKVSTARARECYGVALNARNGCVDLPETHRLRENLKKGKA
jgi:N-methylhydantoinase B